MTPYKKILVPLDGSSLSELALFHAEALAQCFGCEVLLVRICQPVSVPLDLHSLGSGVAEDYNKDLQAQVETGIRDYLTHIQKRLQFKNIKSRCVVREGIVTEVILDIAEAETVDLIIMSTHGRSGVSRWVYGSVASKVLQAAPCPVFLVRAKTARLENSPTGA